MIDRRTFLAGAGAVLLAAPLIADAQQAKKAYKIEYLSPNLPQTPQTPSAFDLTCFVRVPFCAECG